MRNCIKIEVRQTDGQGIRIRRACLSDRRFPANLIFGQAKISIYEEFSISTVRGYIGVLYNIGERK